MRRFQLVVSLLALLLALPAAAGTHYVTETRDGDGRVTGRSEVWTDGTRIKVVESGPDDTRSAADRSYTLSPDGWRTVYEVDPATRTYQVVRLADVFAEVSDALDSVPFIVRWGVSEPEVEVLAREPGADVLGLPTTRYEVRSATELWMRVLFKKWRERMETHEEVWVTDRFRVPRPEARLADLRTGSEKLDRLFALEADKVPGFPLRHHLTTVTTGSDGEEEREVEITEVVELNGGMDLATNLFVVPVGYDEVDDDADE